MRSSISRPELKRQFEDELIRNILPFWMEHTIDSKNGGLHGGVYNDLRIDDDVPRTAILSARSLWTYSAAFRQFQQTTYRDAATHQFRDLTETFWDKKYGGLFWSVDGHRRPVSDRKQHYAQAFGIYGLTEFFRATGSEQALKLARQLFDLLEEHAYDPQHGGYCEGSSRTWEHLTEAPLSERDLPAPKSMNTMLHLLEAYASLAQAQDDAHVSTRLEEIVGVFIDRIFAPATGHLALFFDVDWTPVSNGVSFGHDIEASWLLTEAADVVAKPVLTARASEVARALAQTTLREGVDSDGGLFTETTADGAPDLGKDWWPQAEAIVGFYNAYQQTDDERYRDAALHCWRFTQAAFVDHENGDWFKRLKPNGAPDADRYKAGPWECPYHHSRLCFEMIRRLDETGR